MITPPQQGEPVDELWRKVRELTDIVNALLNEQVSGAINGAPISGNRQVSGGTSMLVIQNL